MEKSLDEQFPGAEDTAFQNAKTLGNVYVRGGLFIPRLAVIKAISPTTPMDEICERVTNSDDLKIDDRMSRILSYSMGQWSLPVLAALTPVICHYGPRLMHAAQRLAAHL